MFFQTLGEVYNWGNVPKEKVMFLLSLKFSKKKLSQVISNPDLVEFLCRERNAK